MLKMGGGCVLGTAVFYKHCLYAVSGMDKQIIIANMIADTTPEAEALLLQLLRQMPVRRKLQLMSQLNEMTRTLALGSLRQQYPQATEDELRRLLADCLLGAELAALVYGPRPRLRGTADGI